MNLRINELCGFEDVVGLKCKEYLVTELEIDDTAYHFFNLDRLMVLSNYLYDNIIDKNCNFSHHSTICESDKIWEIVELKSFFLSNRFASKKIIFSIIGNDPIIKKIKVFCQD